MNSITRHFNRLVSTLTLGAFFCVGVAAASAATPQPVFNGQAQDKPTLQVALPDQPWATSTNAAPGETVNLLVWVHNSVPDTVAHGTTVKVTIPTTEATTHTPRATISATDADSVTGEASIVVGSLSKLTYIPGSAKLYATSEEKLQAIAWPNGVNPDAVVSSGVNIGDIEGCWQFVHAVSLTVRVEGVSVGYPILTIVKDVRKAGTTDAFNDRVTANPGNELEYRITIRNIDNATAARDLRVKDLLPANETFVGPAVLRRQDGTTVTLPNGLVSEQGIIVLPELKPNEKVEITFTVQTATAIAQDTCLVNKAIASASNGQNSVEDTATGCFIVPPTPTPTVAPTPTPTLPPTAPPVKPTPAPVLPKTGPEATATLVLGLAGAGGTAVRYLQASRAVKRQSRKIDVI